MSATVEGRSGDDAELAEFGYKQELDRSLGSFATFAAGISYISILTGTFQLFYFGFAFGGPAYWWSWPLVFVGQLMVALCFCELASRYPIAGSIYNWSKRLSTPHVAWLAGWMMLTASIVTVAAVALAYQITLPHDRPVLPVLRRRHRQVRLRGQRRDPRHRADHLHDHHQRDRRQADVADQQHRRGHRAGRRRAARSRAARRTSRAVRTSSSRPRASAPTGTSATSARSSRPRWPPPTSCTGSTPPARSARSRTTRARTRRARSCGRSSPRSSSAARSCCSR